MRDPAIVGDTQDGVKAALHQSRRLAGVRAQVAFIEQGLATLQQLFGGAR
jgi:hypothetical protein